jgi:DNA-binding XRE family transcriptional regulator
MYNGAMKAARLPLDLADRPAWAQSVVVARCGLGLTQRQLADRAGMHQETLCDYETGMLKAGPRVRARVERALAEARACR